MTFGRQTLMRLTAECPWSSLANVAWLRCCLLALYSNRVQAGQAASHIRKFACAFCGIKFPGAGGEFPESAYWEIARKAAGARGFWRVRYGWNPRALGKYAVDSPVTGKFRTPINAWSRAQLGQFAKRYCS